MSGYYTKTQTDNLLLGKANTSHTHTTGQIDGLQSYVENIISQKGSSVPWSSAEYSTRITEGQTIKICDLPTTDYTEMLIFNTDVLSTGNASNDTTLDIGGSVYTDLVFDSLNHMIVYVYKIPNKYVVIFSGGTNTLFVTTQKPSYYTIFVEDSRLGGPISCASTVMYR